MKSLAEQMAAYTAYHQNHKNRFTHWFGIPLVILSLFILLGWFRVGNSDMSGATLLLVGTLAYYLRLDWLVGLLVSLAVIPMYVIANQWARLPLEESWKYFAVTFVAGWILQLAGHYFEGKRPALMSNALQAFNGPLFLGYEAAVFFGWRDDVSKPNKN